MIFHFSFVIAGSPWHRRLESGLVRLVERTQVRYPNEMVGNGK